MSVGYGQYFPELQAIYLQELGRPIDLDGYTRYSNALATNELTFADIQKIIHESDEATLCMERKETQLKLKTEHNVKIAESIRSLHIRESDIPLHLVVTRYNESIRWIKALAKLDICIIYLYNKGESIEWTDKPHNVYIKNIPNIGFEEYGYIYHLTRMHQYYTDHKTKIIFLQCGLDHCPRFLSVLCHNHLWNTYTSLYEGIGMSNTWSDELNMNTRSIIPVKRDMLDIGGGKEYIDHFKKVLNIKNDDLYEHLCHTFHMTPMEYPIFSPCAVFCVTYTGEISLRTLHCIRNTVEDVYAKGDYFVSKVLASVIERLWYTIFIQNQLG